MNARSYWSAKPDPESTKSKEAGSVGGEPDLPIDDLLDARFDAEGRLAQIGHEGEERSEAAFQPRAPDLGADELERAVQKLAHGLDAIERQSRTPDPARIEAAGDRVAGRDFVTYSLDRLEARLEALSKRLQQRAGDATGSAPEPQRASAPPAREIRRGDPSLAVEPADDREAERAELRRLAEMERARLEAEEAAIEMRRRAAESDSRRRADAEEAERRAEAEEARLRAEIEAAERRAEAAAARRQAETVAVQQQFERLEMRIDALQQQTDENQIEPIRADLLELLQQMQVLGRDGRSIADAVEAAHARLDGMDARVNAARNMAGNRLGDVHDRLGRISGRLEELEIEIPGFDAVRENQGAILERFDRMEGLVQHLAAAEEVLDRVDGVKKQLQTLGSQREVARIEEHMLRLAAQIDRLPEDLSDAAVLGRIEQQLHDLAAEALDVRRERSSAVSQLDQRFAELGGLVREMGESARSPDLGSLEQKLAEIGERLDDDRRSSGDLLGRLERRLTEVASSIETQERAAASQVIAALASKIDALGDAIDAQDVAGARGNIDLLDRKLDQLADALAEQAETLSRPQIEPLEARLDIMQTQLEELSRRTRDSSAQFGPFTLKLQEISDRVNALGLAGAPTPLSQRLSAIEERIAGMAAKGSDPRALQTQLDAILSRLELLKGRSIDPARLTDLFERVDAAIRAVPDDRFERIEQRIGESSIPPDRLDRIERQIAERDYGPLAEERFNRLERKFAERDIAADLEEHFALLARRLGDPDVAGASAERLARLEEKLDALAHISMSGASATGGYGITLDDVSDLRADIASLRREIRSLPPSTEGASDFGDILRSISSQLERLSGEPSITAADLEARIARMAAASDDPRDGGIALGHIESSLQAIEERLEETRRAVADQTGDEDYDFSGKELDAVADMARALSDDVNALKGTAAASERKTKDALDAVQDTLEAVVKRMAFIERDADAPPPRPSDSGSDAERPGRRIDLQSETEPQPDPQPRDASSSLLSRFTSRQLLKRATGGRAESFAPDADETEDLSDFPLEPNTDAPLTSDLSGAPSSDTALLSGSRNRGRAADGPGGRDRRAILSPYRIDEDDDDFLVAARRAARAAAAEAAAADDIGPTARAATKVARSIGTRRHALMAAALAIAVAFAAYQIIRNQIDPGSVNTAAPAQSTSQSRPVVEAAPTAAAPADERRVASAPTAPRVSSQAPASARRAAAPPAAATPTASVRTPPAPSAPVAAATPAAAPNAVARATTPAAAKPDAASVFTPAAQPPQPLTTGAARPAAATPAPANKSFGETDRAIREATEPDAETRVASLGAAPTASPPATGAAVQAALPTAIGPERLRGAALSGDPLAAFEVATRFAEGRNIPQDMPAAVSWYERAAGAGMAPAQYRLGSIYEKGLGVERDLSQAQEWYQQAADAGNVKAMHNLAVLYAEGAGGEPDLEGAAALFRQAAEHGVRDSQFNLAILHARGLGVTQDLIEAYKWFDIAARSGDEESEKRRDIIAAALSQSDLAKAEAAASDFEPLPLIAEVNEVMMPDGGWGEDATAVGVETGTEVSENDLVALVQKLLAERGYDPGPPDGLLGRQTIEAISAYQEELGVPVTGQIDDRLVTALREQST